MMEQKRGCGYRKIGGLYLVCDGAGIVCYRLPIPVHVCPVCNQGIKQSRGYTWIDPVKLFGNCTNEKHECHKVGCVACDPLLMVAQTENKQAGLMWVGKKFYSAESFTNEAMEQGISKRISAIPQGFELNKTWVLLAHPEAYLTTEKDKDGKDIIVRKPGIFRAFRPSRIEKIITKEQSENKEEMEALSKRGITPVVVDDTPEHRGTVYDKKTENGTLDEYMGDE